MGRKITKFASSFFKKLTAVLLLFSATGLSIQLHAQDEVIKIDTKLVAVPVSVLDKDGRYISTLEKDNFKLLENGVEQQIDSFGTVDNHVTVLMLLERTGVIRFQLPRLVDAANAFVRQMRAEDTFIAMSFGNGADTIIKETKIKDVPHGVRINRLGVDRYVLVYEAVDTALKRLEKVSGRKAIVLFSEGLDSEFYSSPNAKKNLKDAEESGATIYTVKFNTTDKLPTPDYIKRNRGYVDRLAKAREYMASLAARTGGRSFQVEQIEDLDKTFSEVASELVRQYTLGYYPNKPGTNGERRSIKVQVNLPNLIVRSRHEVIFREPKK